MLPNLNIPNPTAQTYSNPNKNRQPESQRFI